MTAATRSLNEIQSLALKAARGAGWEWGLAEEWGYAAKWLAARRLPLVLAAVLQQRTLMMAAPAEAKNPLSANAALCPLRTGLCLSDNPRRFAAGAAVKNVQTPLWLLPFAARLGTVKVLWQGTEIVSSNARIWLLQQDGLTADAADVSVAPSALPQGEGIRAADCGCPLDEEEWRRLEALAYKTLVPATAASRAHGAGAGVRDDD